MTDKISVAVLVGSVRKGRFGPTVADWCVGQMRHREDLIIKRVDVADVPIPADLAETAPDEASAVLGEVEASLTAADAFVVVTPEYNHSFPGGLKNFIDWHYYQWQAKPVCFVSYGGMAGGVRAVEHLRHVFAELHAVTTRDMVTFHGASECFHADGEPVDPAGCGAAMKVMLDQLVWFGRALRDARNRTPYGPR
jgi:NAD(P)H-dependent FMN reductase